ncbi:MAG: hypothetical protein FWE18_03410 [Alphaproteobacteria bacterium]|nr:hypothetical protein [Alphaproteobacteria bacterium]
MIRKFSLLAAAFAVFFVTACGTLLKPQQINRAHSGRLDTTIVVLNAIGLLFFLIPGIIAFAVDYSNGTLFLPKGKYALNDTSAEGIQKALVANGYDITLDQVKLAMNTAN